MRLRASFFVMVLVASLTGVSTTQAVAGNPTYLVLRAAPPPPGKHHVHGLNPGEQQGVTAMPYAYGWFGVKPTTQWSRHFGYHRNYTQWSSR